MDEAKKQAEMKDIADTATISIVRGVLEKHGAPAALVVVEQIITNVVVSLFMSYDRPPHSGDEAAIQELADLLAKHVVENSVPHLKRLREDPDYRDAMEAKIN